MVLPQQIMNTYPWIFIAVAMACATLASASTLSMATVQERFMGCNSTSAACFAMLGMIPGRGTKKMYLGKDSKRE